MTPRQLIRLQYMSFTRRILATFAVAGLLAATGCHSRYIEATVTNATASPVSLVEVDYPSASFGRESIPAGGNYHYRFKVLGDGPTKVLWTDATHHDHTVPGPTLHEGDEGTLAVTLSPATATWNLTLKPR
ncbi:MAG TPA: hypothetical protein VIJ79_00040 [Acidobacteriaceae bacterium]